MAKRFLECSLEQEYLLPPSLHDWLPEGHLARFIVDVTEQLDLGAIYAAYQRHDGRGKAAYHPLLMIRLLLYGYAIGVRSSRAMEKATYDDLAFRYLSANQHPDHDTIAHFRRQHLEAIGKLFAQALALCRRAGLVKLGVLAIDGTKVKAVANKRDSMRLQRIREEEQRLERLVNEVLQEAARTDAEEDARWGKGQPADSLPAGLDRAQERLRRLREAKQVLEAEAAAQLAEAEARHPKRKPGRKPKNTPQAKTPPWERENNKQALHRARKAVAGHTRNYNFTDPDSRLMRDAESGGAIQAYNAQIAVDGAAQIIVAAAVTQQEMDRRQLVPMAEAARRALGTMPESVVADAGYWNYSQLLHPVFEGATLIVPPGRANKDNRSLRADHPVGQGMREKLANAVGQQLYRTRQSIVEPVFAYIKERRSFRRFSFRGLHKVQAEWSLLCLTHNLLKLYRSKTALRPV